MPCLDRTRSRRTAVAAHFHFHECVRLPCESQPVDGRIERMVYRAGKFLSADLDKASEDNERNAFVIATASGPRIAVIQMPGSSRGAIVPFTREGETVGAASVSA